MIRTSFNDVQCLYIASGYLKENETLNIRGITLDANTMGQINRSLISVNSKNVTLNFENVTFKNFKIDGYGSLINLVGNGAAGSTINMTNCTIENCEAKGGGGAIYINADNSTLNLNNTAFNGCKSQGYGGAIYLHSNGIRINGRNNSSFNDCAAGSGYYGGAIYIENWPNCEINGENGFSFNRNRAKYGGAIYVNDNGAKITGCQFSGNTAADSGGAIYVNGDTQITNCSFQNNSSQTYGGAMYIHRYTVNVDRCKFTGNSSKEGGALYLNSIGGIHVRDSEFYSNRANAYGGAICIYWRGNTIESCRFGGDNNARYGNDIYSHASRTTYLKNCRFSRSRRAAIYGNFTITNCQFGVSNSLNDAGQTDETAVEEAEESDASGLATFLSNGNKIIIIVGIAIMLLAVIYAVMRSNRRKEAQ